MFLFPRKCRVARKYKCQSCYRKHRYYFRWPYRRANRNSHNGSVEAGLLYLYVLSYLF